MGTWHWGRHSDALRVESSLYPYFYSRELEQYCAWLEK
jgi:hypothetical protein